MKQSLLMALLLCSTLAMAQPPAGAAAAMGNIARVYGRILDGETKEPLGYASAVLMSMTSDSVISGQLSQDNGDFAIEHLPTGSFRLRVSMIGYKEQLKNVRIAPPNFDQDLGDFVLQPDSKLLNEAIVTAEREKTQLGIDRKVYNVDKDVMAQNGTAIDAIKNVPTLMVDADGKAKLRNGEPQIFVDGKPSTLSLDQIPGTEIERIEVITNPSARFDANATSGIINIVLKKNLKPGFSGMVNLGAGTNNRYNTMAALNLRQGAVNFSLSGAWNQSGNLNKGFTDRTYLDTAGNPTIRYRQDNLTDATVRFSFVRAGIDWQINNRTSLSVSENVGFRSHFFDDPQVYFFEKASTSQLLSTGSRTSLAHNQNQNYTTEVTFKRTYAKPEKEWTASAQYVLNGGGNRDTLTYTAADAAGNPIASNPSLVYNQTNSSGYQFIAQTDFVNPLTDKSRIEFGAKTQIRNSVNDQTANLFNEETQSWAISEVLSTDYRFDEYINAIYVNYANALNEKWRYQAGLRFESSVFNGASGSSDSTFRYAYPSSIGNAYNTLFPSVYFSKKVSPTVEMQFNVSRKINRPGFFQAMPFVMMVDNQTYRTGNPNLVPEFVNMAEWNRSKSFKNGSWLISVYGKYTQNAIADLSTKAPDGSEAVLVQFINTDGAQDGGMENTVKYKMFDKLNITANANVFYRRISAGSLTNEGFSGNGKLIFDYRIIKNLSATLTGQYEAPRIIPQGTQKANYFSDFALKYELGPIASATFTISDIFDTKRFGGFISADFAHAEWQRRRESRYFMVGLQARFGKPDFSLFKKQQRRPAESSGNSGDMGF